MTTPAVSPPRTPVWLTSREATLCPCGCIGRRSRVGFIERTLHGVSRLVQQAMFADDTAERDGLLQRIEPVVKLATLLGLLVITALLRHMPVLMVTYVATLIVAARSLIPVGFFVRRVWLFVPLFTGVIVIPATFSFVTAGDIVVPLGRWFGSSVGLTSQGLSTAGLLVLRVATSVSLVTLLSLTTPWPRLLAALRVIKVPTMFIMVLSMTYRYVVDLLHTVIDMYDSRRARTTRRDRDGVAGRRVVAATAGATFAKAHELSNEVHMAMLSRGYTGVVRSPVRPVIRPLDGVWISTCVAGSVAVLVLDRLLGG